MPGPLKNARHERFAQELAGGKSQAEAYKIAGYKPNDTHASRLVRNGKVAERVAELKAAVAEKTVVTAANLTERLLKIAEKGEGSAEAPLLSVARASIMDVAKLNGLIIDKQRHSFDFTNLTDDDIDKLETILAKSAVAR